MSFLLWQNHLVVGILQVLLDFASMCFQLAIIFYILICIFNSDAGLIALKENGQDTTKVTQVHLKKAAAKYQIQLE